MTFNSEITQRTIEQRHFWEAARLVPKPREAEAHSAAVRRASICK